MTHMDLSLMALFDFIVLLSSKNVYLKYKHLGKEKYNFSPWNEPKQKKTQVNW